MTKHCVFMLKYLCKGTFSIFHQRFFFSLQTLGGTYGELLSLDEGSSSSIGKEVVEARPQAQMNSSSTTLQSSLLQ
jgi:hypothetical protein